MQKIKYINLIFYYKRNQFKLQRNVVFGNMIAIQPYDGLGDR